MKKEKYETIKNALIATRDEKLLEEFKNLMEELDNYENKIYCDNYQKYDYMSLTIEEEEEKVSNLVDLIKKREKEHNEYEDDYNYIVGSNPDFLTQVLYIDKLKDLETRLETIKEYLSIKERIVNLSMNIKEYKKELKNNPSNRRLETKLNKSTKKVNDLLNSLKKENILILLYEFCIIDTFDKEKVDNGLMLKNILSTKVKKKEDQVKKINEERVISPKVTKIEVEEDNNSNNNYENQEIVKEEVPVNNDVSVNIDTKKENITSIDNNTKEDKLELDDYVKKMIPEGMPILSQIGTVKPVSMMEKLEKAQEEEKDLTIPSMGMLENNNTVNIDSNEFLNREDKA